MDTISIGADGYYHPASDDQVAQLIKRANAERLKVRVRGSGHSIKYAIFTDHFRDDEGDKDGIDILLDQLNYTSWDKVVSS